jgi:hypothetical protein
MSAALIRDLVVVQTRGLKLPGIARTFEGSPGKRAMPIGRTKIICTRSSVPSKPRGMSPSSVSGSTRPAFQR